MMFIRVFFVAIFINFTCSFFTQAGSNGDAGEIYEVEHLYLLSAPGIATQSIEDISNNVNTPWQQLHQTHGRFELPAGTSWLKVYFRNEKPELKNLYLTIKNQLQMVNVEFFSQIKALPIKSFHASLSHANFYYGNVPVAPNSELTLYIRIKSDVQLNNTLMLMDDTFFERLLSKREFYNGIAIGGMIFLSLIFWILYFGSRDKLVGILAAYFTLRSALLSVFLGGNLFYFYGQDPTFRGFEIPILAVLSSYFYIWFSSSLLQLRTMSPQLHKWSKRVKWLILAYIPISFIFSVDISIALTGVLMIGVMIYLLLVGLSQIKNNQRLAMLFSSVMVLHLLLSLAVAAVEYFNIKIFANREPLQMVSFWLNSLLVVSLVSRLYYYQLKDKQRVQLEALEHAVASKKAQENLFKLQEENQEELEQRVQERTLELNIALSELEALNLELEQKNTADELTGLYNRRFYDQKILAEYRRSKRNLTQLSLVLLDIDHFKSINDTYGHLAGDHCLSWVGQVIKQNIKRSTDLACRYGGEEFVLILPDTDLSGAMALAESIREAIAAFEFVYQKQHIPMTISCGVCTYKQPSDAVPEDIFLAADKALYLAKKSGRNKVQHNEIANVYYKQE